MTIDRKTLTVIAVSLAIGYWLASSSSSPVGPSPTNGRPVLRLLARAAKTLLWVSLVAEQPPQAEQTTYVVHARIGDDGAPIINHARGW